MPVNKLRVVSRVLGATDYTGEWAALHFNSADGGLHFASRDTVVPTRGVMEVVAVPIAGASLHSGVLSWRNPEPGNIIVSRVDIVITTVSSGACTLDVGTTPTDATTASDNLIDGADMTTTAPCVLNSTDTDGSSAKTRQLLATGKWVTFKEASGNATGLAATAYIHYLPVF